MRREHSMSRRSVASAAGERLAPGLLLAICPRLLHGVPRPIANVAAPVIGRDLGPSLTGVQWVVDGYSVVFAGRLRTGGALGNRFGARRVFLAVVCVQSGASFGCKVAWNMLLVNGFRLLQGTRAACSCRAR